MIDSSPPAKPHLLPHTDRPSLMGRHHRFEMRCHLFLNGTQSGLELGFVVVGQRGLGDLASRSLAT